jgi:hypothetical protein
MPLTTGDDLPITEGQTEFGPLAHALAGELERAQDAVTHMAVGVLRAAELAKDPAVVEGAGWGEVEALRGLPEDLDALAAVLEALRHYARSLAAALPRGTEE